jgi:diacylglycerol kinase (ATP)
VSRVLLIFNPAAAKTDAKVLRAVSGIFAAQGWEVDVANTTWPGHAKELARSGADDGVDVIAVYGGDGTTMQAMAGIVGRGVPVGLIPGGTGNLLAKNLRLPLNPHAAARVVAGGKPHPIDLGLLYRDDGDRYFSVACGAGVDAEMMAGATDAAKRRWGMGAYVAEIVRSIGRIQIVPYRVTVDGKSFETDAATVFIANCRDMLPPFLALKKDIEVDDGLFDVVVVNARTLLQGLEFVWRINTGRVNRNDRLRFLRGTRVTVETAIPRPVQLDGEPGGMTPFTAEIVPGAIGIVRPR